ncbi:hypothetical protein CVU37_02315 [candidate division BRC1 bacterium HGW-BRC1-1]|jgi:hypothetical protein|nr:MAG: hypothetical protein CVU37_02315 [candidate division BRC1 bacterium HGW-BRC1-1]
MRWVSVLLVCLGAGVVGAAGLDASTTSTREPAAARVAVIAERLRATQRTPVAAQRDVVRLHDPLTTASVAGYYADPGPTKRGGLSGEDLYLFPDETFMYLRWADIMPRTILSKGAWALDEGYVTLHDDGETSLGNWGQHLSPVWLPLVVDQGTTQSFCLMDGRRDIEYLKNKSLMPSTGRTIIRLSLEKSRDLPTSETAALKADMRRKYWRPHYLANDGLKDEGTVHW